VDNIEYALLAEEKLDLEIELDEIEYDEEGQMAQRAGLKNDYKEQKTQFKTAIDRKYQLVAEKFFVLHKDGKTLITCVDFNDPCQSTI